MSKIVSVMAMTFERMELCMGNLTRQYKRGLLSHDSYAAEMAWVIKERRETLEREHTAACNEEIERFQRGFITMDEMISKLYELRLAFESATSN